MSLRSPALHRGMQGAVHGELMYRPIPPVTALPKWCKSYNGEEQLLSVTGYNLATAARLQAPQRLVSLEVLFVDVRLIRQGARAFGE